MSGAPCTMLVLGGWYGPTYNVVLFGRSGAPTESHQDAVADLFGIGAPEFHTPMQSVLTHPGHLLDSNGRPR